MDLDILNKISYGLYVVSSMKDKEKFNGQIANAVVQTTAEPPTIAVCINKQNLTHEFIEKSKVFSVSILSKETPMQFIGRFGFKSGREFDKFNGIKYKIGKTGAPIVVENALGYVEAEVLSSVDVGTHTIFIGKVVETETINKGEPMTYEYYRRVKGGLSPKTAPTYQARQENIQQKNKGGEPLMEKYKCSVCGYIYDPATGDPESGIKPGTPFDKLPDTWVCPVCGAGKDAFEKID